MEVKYFRAGKAHNYADERTDDKKKKLREEFDMKLKKAERRYGGSATKQMEDTVRQPLTRSTSRNVRGNVEQQLIKTEDRRT